MYFDSLTLWVECFIDYIYEGFFGVHPNREDCTLMDWGWYGQSGIRLVSTSTPLVVHVRL